MSSLIDKSVSLASLITTEYGKTMSDTVAALSQDEVCFTADNYEQNSKKVRSKSNHGFSEEWHHRQCVTLKKTVGHTFYTRPQQVCGPQCAQCRVDFMASHFYNSYLSRGRVSFSDLHAVLANPLLNFLKLQSGGNKRDKHLVLLWHTEFLFLSDKNSWRL